MQNPGAYTKAAAAEQAAAAQAAAETAAAETAAAEQASAETAAAETAAAEQAAADDKVARVLAGIVGAKGGVPYPHVALMVRAPGGAGKSTTIERLAGKEFNAEHPSSVGVEVEDLELNAQKLALGDGGAFEAHERGGEGEYSPRSRRTRRPCSTTRLPPPRASRRCSTPSVCRMMHPTPAPRRR